MGMRPKGIARVAIRLLGAVALAFFAPHVFADAIYDVTINTSALDGTGATLAFDLIAGGGTETNTVTISDFAIDGTLGASGPNSGSVTGTLPGTITLSNANFFNEILQRTTLGNAITFDLDATSNAPTGGSLPDTFSFFLLDPTSTYSLLTTTDPTGSDSLFTLQIDGSSDGILGNYTSVPPVSATLVPSSSTPSVSEPGTIGLALSSLLVILCRRSMVLRRACRF